MLNEHALAWEMLDERSVGLNTKDCVLPPLHKLFSTPPWEYKNFRAARAQLDETKGRLDKLNRR